MRGLFPGLLMLLTGCSTAELAEKAPVGTYGSERSREAIAECLEGRLAGMDYRVRRGDGADSTIVVVAAPLGNPMLHFLIRAAAGGSVTEMRRGGDDARTRERGKLLRLERLGAVAADHDALDLDACEFVARV